MTYAEIMSQMFAWVIDTGSWPTACSDWDQWHVTSCDICNKVVTPVCLCVYLSVICVSPRYCLQWPVTFTAWYVDLCTVCVYVVCFKWHVELQWHNQWQCHTDLKGLNANSHLPLMPPVRFVTNLWYGLHHKSPECKRESEGAEMMIRISWFSADFCCCHPWNQTMLVRFATSKDNTQHCRQFAVHTTENHRTAYQNARISTLNLRNGG